MTRPTMLPLSASLLFLLALFPRPAHSSDTWIEVHSPHFTVTSNSSEKEARRVATQFEEIRSVFLTVFPSLILDPGKPISVIALKNEDSLKTFLPDYWAVKDRVHPTGIFVLGLDRNFAVLRTDVTASDENAYQHLYFEYASMILRLNYAALPLWLDIGLCQYFGNTVVESGEIGVGHINKWQLQLLKRTPLIPVKTLIDADQRSPLYNEQDHASMFYAESWMLVHFLMGDPDARKAQTFSHFLKVYEETNDTDQAAIQAFGNLGHLEVQLQEYARQTQFRYQRFPSKASISANDYTSRPLSPPEALALHGDFLAHSGHAKEAKELLQEAVKQQPTLASAFTSLGWVHYQLHDNEAAQAALDQAISLDPQNFVPYHFRALLLLRVSGYRKDSTPQIIADLEKVTALNPSFAPAYGFLSVAYRQQDATKAKSLPAALKAAKLQPANFAFSVDVGDSLLAENHDQEAAKFLDRLNKAARSPNEKSMVESFAKRLAAHRDTASQKSAAVPPASASSDPGDSSGGSSAAKISVSAQEGIIRDASCSSSPLNVQFAILGETLSLAISDLANLPIRVAGKNASLSENPCQQWKGRKARISYSPAADNSPSEISSIDFF